jgi:hypothetical protein
VSPRRITALLLVVSLLGLSGCGESSEVKATEPTPKPTPVAESWTAEVDTDDFGDTVTWLRAKTTNDKGEIYQLNLRCAEKSLGHLIGGASESGYLLTWATYDVSIRLDGGDVLKWPAFDSSISQALAFQMSTSQLIAKLKGRKTLSLKALPAYTGGGESTHIFTMPIDGLEDKLGVLTDAGCKV